MQKRKVKILLSLVAMLSVILFLSMGSVHATSINQKVLVKLEVSDNGEAVSGGRYRALNIEQIYSKISQGNFSEEDTSSSAWTELKQTYSSQNNIITLSNGLEIGPGVVHSPEDTANIIRLLMNSTTSAVLSLNGSGNIAPGGASASAAKFGVEGVKGQPFTNSKGEASANLPSGYTMITDSNNKLLRIIKVTEGMKPVKIDIASPDSGITISVTNLPDSTLSAHNQYTIEYGREVDYKITLDQSYYANGGTLRISPKANLVVDNISFASQKVDAFPPTINPSVYDNSITSIGQIKTNMEGSLKKLGDAISTLPLYNYDLTIPPLSENLSIIVKTHVETKVDFNTTVTFPPNAEVLPLTIPLLSYNDPEALFGFEVTMESGGESVRTESPNLNVTGINFVQLDTQKRKLVKGGKYLLGKVEKGKTLLYSNTASWTSVDNLSALDLTQYMQLKPGNIYVVGLNSPLPIPLNTTLFDFNVSRDSAVNDSLIKISGLESGTDYFLYPIGSPKGYDLQSKEIKFKAFRNEKSSSIGKAKKQDYKINSLIPDFSTGSTEYNILSVTPTSPSSINPTLLIRLAIGFAIFIVFGITVIIIRKF
ncbi:hypothetical protein ABUK63_06015 [Lactococcus lactis]|uniref:hypothetical protein n=1 Tax=Lactococcus lactis TaxID=1358 RepID=UPI003D2E75EC